MPMPKKEKIAWIVSVIVLLVGQFFFWVLSGDMIGEAERLGPDHPRVQMLSAFYWTGALFSMAAALAILYLISNWRIRAQKTKYIGMMVGAVMLALTAPAAMAGTSKSGLREFRDTQGNSIAVEISHGEIQ